MTNIKKHIITERSSISCALEALNKLSNNVLTLFVVNGEGKLLGTLTDGDIRRYLIKNKDLDGCVCEAMNHNFHFLYQKKIFVEKIKELRKQGIKLLPILDESGSIKHMLNLKEKKSMLPIDAVLMAGGKGERLRPLTDTKPKPLLTVGEKCIIDHNIDSLLNYGINHISVTTNYLGEQIEEHFKGNNSECEIKCIREPKYLGTIGSIKFIEQFYNDIILVMNSDLFTNINYEDFFLHFQKHNADMSVATVPYTVSIPYGTCDIKDRKIISLQEKPTYNYYINSGIYLIKKHVINLIPDDTFFNATDLIDKLIAENLKVIRFPLVGYWIDIGKHEDYEKAQDFIKHLE